MAKRLYFGNVAAPYTPATIRGAWDQTSGAVVTKMLTPSSVGAAATVAIAEVNVSPTWDVFMGRWISQPLLGDVSFATSDTLQMITGLLESNLAADFVSHLYVYVTTGDSDTQRGVLLTDTVASPLATEEWPTTAAGNLFNNSAAIALSNNVSAKAGDRIVVEFGYQAQNAVTTSRTGTMNYGNNGATDLTDTNTNVTTRPGWIEFSVNFTVGVQTRTTVPTKPPGFQIDWNNSITQKMIYDAPFQEGGGTNIVDIVRGKKLAFVGAPVWKNSSFGKAVSFNGTSTAASLASPVSTVTSNFTMEVWCTLNTIQAPGEAMIWYIGSDVTGNGYGIEVDHGLVEILMRGVALWSAENVLLAGQLCHIVFVDSLGSTANKVYINGLDCGVSNSNGPAAPTASTTFAQDSSSAKWGDVTIHWARFWERAMNKSEIVSLYENPLIVYKQPPIFRGLNSISSAVVYQITRMMMGMGM